MNPRKLLLLAVLAAALAFTACGGESGNAPAPQGQTVQVSVTDDHIQMPVSLPSGITTFEVKNAGTHAHSFGIVGPGGDETLEQPLQPGETATLEMPLEAGTYRIYCPVDQQHGDPMQMALNVTDEPAHG